MFARSTLTPKTPPSNQKTTVNEEMMKSPLNNQRGSKRPYNGVTLEDIFNQMQVNQLKLSSDMKSLESTLDKKIDLIASTLKLEIDTISTKLQNIEKSNKEEFKKMTEDNRKYINNALKQQMLDCCMDIEGLKDEVISKSSDLKALVVATIKSFNIQIMDNDIEKAVLTEINKGGINKKIITTTFADRNVKLRVIKGKRERKDSNDIYFNITMTPLNSFLMRKAKQLGKPLNLRVVFYDCAVHVKKLTGEDFVLTNESSLLELEDYIQQQGAAATITA